MICVLCKKDKRSGEMLADTVCIDCSEKEKKRFSTTYDMQANDPKMAAIEELDQDRRCGASW